MGSGIYIFRGGLSPRFSFRFGGRSKAFRLRGNGGEGGYCVLKVLDVGVRDGWVNC